MSRASKFFSILLPFVLVTIGTVCVLVRAEGVKGRELRDSSTPRVYSVLSLFILCFSVIADVIE